MSHSKDSLQVPQSGWLNVLAETGLPRRGSFGFNENYMSDSAPPFCSLDDDSGFSSSFKNNVVSSTPPAGGRLAFSIPMAAAQDLPSPSENLLFSHFENYKSATADLAALDLDGNHCSGSADSPCEDDQQCVVSTTPKLQPKAFRDPGSLTEKVVDCITMENFPVATAESLDELDRLKKQITSLVGCDTKDHLFTCETIEPSPNMDGEPLDGASRVRFETSSSKPDQTNKLATLLFNQPFAQSWFFKNVTHSDSTSVTSSQTGRMKEINIWAPHNL